MNGKETLIKNAMEYVEVPEDRLDQIIEDAFWNTTVSKKKKKRRNWLVPLAAASLLFVGISAASLSASPALANYMSQLPGIGNVFSVFAEEEPGLQIYERFSEEVGLVQTSQGITIRIDQAIYDGTKVTFTYTVTSDRTLDSSAHLTGLPQLLEAEGPNISTNWEPVEGGIAGMTEITHPDEKAAQVNVLWEPLSLYTEEGEIEGDWKFEFAVDQLIKEPIILDEKVTNGDVTVHFTEVTVTAISVNVTYQQLVNPALLEVWEHVEAELIAQDNLGNVYKVPYNGGSTYAGDQTIEDIHWTATMRGLHPEASSLTFYPFAHVSRFDIEKGSEFYRVELDAIEFDLIDGTYQFIEEPVFPELPEPEEEEE